MKNKQKNILLSVAVLAFLSCTGGKKAENEPAAEAEKAPVTFCADSAMNHIGRQCAFGPRVPNSKAHDDCAAFIAAKFRGYGLDVTEQKTTVRGWDGQQLACNNITASYKPDAARRIVIATHWESRPWADADPDSSKHREPVMAANDGASGVAVMLEVARLLGQLHPAIGIDFVCFDAEDYGAPYWGEAPDDGSDWCLGSAYWSKHLPEGYKPEYGILLDMVGGLDAQFRFEYYSRKYAEHVLAKVWGCAATAGADTYFKAEDGAAVTDDHLNMNAAGIPTIDIIADNGNGFCATWHTTQDVPANISTETLQAVGQTLLQVIFEEK